MATIRKNFGAITAYGLAKEGGYTGTKKQFQEGLIESATAAATATQKAQEAAASATGAAEAKTAAQTAQTASESARDDAAQSAQDAAQSATAAQDAQDAAEEAARSALKIVIGPVSDKGIVYGSASCQVSWTDPDDVVLYGAVIALWKRTQVVMKAGSYPTGPEDGTVVGYTDREDATYSKNHYQGTALVVSGLEEGETYYFKAFGQTTAGVWNDLTANEFPEYTSITPYILAEHTEAGDIQDYVALGDLLDAEHPDFPGANWRVTGFDCNTPANAAITHTLDLEMEQVLFTAPCDAPEAQYALTEDEAASAGKAYYAHVGSAYTLLTVTEGATVATLDGVDYPISEWFEKNPNTSYQYGTNIISQMNSHYWMNSEGAAGEWSAGFKATIWDTMAPALASRNGFLHSMPQAWKDAIIPVRRIAAIATLYGGGFETWEAKVFFPSLYEVFGTSNGGGNEGKAQFGYYVGAANETRIKTLLDSPSIASTWRLGSPNVSGGYGVCYVTATGAGTSSGANGAYGFSPACAIGKLRTQA